MSICNVIQKPLDVCSRGCITSYVYRKCPCTLNPFFIAFSSIFSFLPGPSRPSGATYRWDETLAKRHERQKKKIIINIIKSRSKIKMKLGFPFSFLFETSSFTPFFYTHKDYKEEVVVVEEEGGLEKESILFFKCSHEELIQFISDPRTVKHSNSRRAQPFSYMFLFLFSSLWTHDQREREPPLTN